MKLPGPAGPVTPPPPRNPAPPPRPVPPPPRPTRALSLPMAVAFIAVGVLILTLHFFAPVLLLAALPVKEWRRAAQLPAAVLAAPSRGGR